jgi:uncharacterized protein involved in outer membrane biogenesis
MKLRTVLIAVVVLVVALVATGIGIIMSIDFNQYRPQLAAQAKALTGRDLNLAGDLDVALSLVPTVVVNDVSFANAEWGSRPEMVKVERLEFEMALLPLLSGEIQVKRVVLNGADILLETNAAGTPNWTFASASEAEPTAPAEGGGGVKLPTVNSIAIEDARLTYRDGTTGESQTVALASFSATADSATSPIAIDLEGTLNDNPIKLSGSVGALQGLLDNQPFAVDLAGEGGGATFTVKGTIAEPKAGRGVALELSAKGGSLADMTALTGSELPPLGPYSVLARLTDQEGGYQVEGLQARMGESDVSGSAGIALGGPRPRITAALTSTKLDFKDFGVEPQPAVEGTAAPSGDAGGSDGRVFPADPLPFDGLKAVDASVKFTGQQVIKAPVTMENVAANLTLENGKLTVTQLDTGISGGTVAINGVVDASQAKPGVALKVTARQVEAGTLSQTLGLTKVLSGGKVDLDLDVTGTGNSVREILAGLNGTSNMEMGQGRINNRFAEIVLADLVKLLTFSGSGDSSNLNCMVIRFDFANGLATSKGLVVDTNGATIVGSGDIHLDSEKLDMRFDPGAKETNLVNLAIPVMVGGTLASPSVVPDPAALAQGVAGVAVGAATGGVFGALAGLATGGSDSGSGTGDNPCANALAGGTGEAAPKSTSEQILDGAGGAIDGAGGAVKDAGEALKGLFD